MGHRAISTPALAALALIVTGLGVLSPPPASAAASDVVINELMYHAVSDLDGDDYVELYNPGSTAVDLAGWTFSKGVTATLPAGATIAAGGYFTVVRDAAQYQTRYGRTAGAVYTGNLSNSGETVTLNDATGAVIDTVTYGTDDPWPTKADGTGPSLERIDASINDDSAINWAAATNTAGATPGAPNSVRRTGLGPNISGVTATPTAPAANQPVTISATITDHTSATLRYRIDFNAEQSLPMTNTTGDTYTATIPGAAAGHLIRYRVEAANANTTSRSPRIDDTINYRGIVVQDGVTSAIPIFRWFIADTDYNAITSSPTQDISRTAVLAYGDTVYDNVTVNIRGQGSESTPKPNWKFEMAKNHDLDMGELLKEPVDEFAMQADWSDVAHGRSLLGFDAFQRAGVVNTQVFPVRTQRNGAFQGIYNYLDLYDGTWRDREGYDDDQLFKANINAFDSSVPLANRRFEKKNPDDTDYAPLQAFLNGVALTGTAEHNYMAANADIPQMIDYAAVTAILDHVDSSTKNFYLANDPDVGRWKILPWDLDHTLGNHCCFVNSDFVTPAEPGDRINPIMEALLATPEWRDMYFRRVRTLVNDLLADGRMESLYDARVAIAHPEIALDYAKYPYGTKETYSRQRTVLFNAIAGRRTVFNSDSRVPGNQPAAPNMMIDEIQHSPAGGDAAEFVELYNPANTAIDLSGWGLNGAGMSLTIQPGTVILPQSTMTFISDDPTFRSTYGSTVFVGDRYDDTLAASGTLTLTRPDSSTADSVTYGGTGWPTSTTGQSLQLNQLTVGDHNDPAAWSLSTGQGTPGTTTGTGPVITAPAAPTTATATAGNASATVRWTAPTDTGGSAITGYTIRVLNSAGTQVGALITAGATATSAPVTGLTNGTSYHFQVAATNTAGTSTYSASSNTITPTSGTTAPAAPTIGTATGANASATVRWTAPTNTGGSAITGYTIRVLDNTDTQDGALRTAPAGATSLVVTGLTNGTSYHFQVAATNTAGTSTYSASSNTITPTSGGGATVPGAPTIGTPTQGATGGALTAIAHWTLPTNTGGSTITGMQVTALRMSSTDPDATVLSRTDSRILGPKVKQYEFTLPTGTYRFEVVAINANGTSPPSNLSTNITPR